MKPTLWAASRSLHSTWRKKAILRGAEVAGQAEQMGVSERAVRAPAGFLLFFPRFPRRASPCQPRLGVRGLGMVFGGREAHGAGTWVRR